MRVRFLDMDVRVVEAPGTRGHTLHSAAKATPHISTLVSPYNSAPLLVVLIHRVHRVRQVVRCNELLRSLHNVHVLRSESDALQAAQVDINGDHHAAASTNGHWLHHKHHRLPVPGERPDQLSHHAGQRQIQPGHVLQLLCPFRQILSESLPGRQTQQEGGEKELHQRDGGLREAEGELKRRQNFSITFSSGAFLKTFFENAFQKCLLKDIF